MRVFFFYIYIYFFVLQLILLKTGGHMIYSGPLGQHSSRVIEYFEVSLL
jgi:hypothetical protein